MTLPPDIERVWGWGPNRQFAEGLIALWGPERFRESALHRAALQAVSRRWVADPKQEKK